MPLFHYKAKKGPEEIVESTIEAKTKEEAISKIDKMGYVPTRVSALQKDAGGVRPESKPAFGLNLFGRVKPRDVTMFIEQLASLIRSKIPVFEAIKILSGQIDNPEFKKVITSIYSELKDGKTLSESLRKYPHIFPKLFINMVDSGESGGVLEETLSRAAKFRQEEEELKSKVASALAYPLFIMAVGVLTIILLLVFVVPRLTFLFADMGQALPVPTQILIAISDSIRNYWYWGVLFIAGLSLAIKKQGIIKKNKLAVDKLKLKIPLLGDFFKEAMLARFSRTFGVLLANGIPVFQALAIVVPSLENEVFKKELETIKADVVSGASFAAGMKKSEWFPSFITSMIATSEKSGNLEEGLFEVANFYEREVNKTMKIITSLIEPAIILVMGLIVAFIVAAMILPIFDITAGMG